MELCDLESISEMCGIQVSGERGEVGTCIYTDCFHSPFPRNVLSSAPLLLPTKVQKREFVFTEDAFNPHDK